MAAWRGAMATGAILAALAAGPVSAGEIRLVGDATPEACTVVRGVLAGELAASEIGKQQNVGLLELGDWAAAGDVDFTANYYREIPYGAELGLDHWDLDAVSQAATTEFVYLGFSQCLLDAGNSIKERVSDGKLWHQAYLTDSRGNTISITTAEATPGTIAVRLSLKSPNPPL